MIRIFLLTISCLSIIFSCTSQSADNSKPDVEVTPGSYSAAINTSGVEEDVKAYSMTSNVSFTFQDDKTFIYSVRAMGKAIDDIGQWEVKGDSLFIFALDKGPDSAFEIVEVGEGQYEINGPNRFVLTKSDVDIVPSQN